MTDVPEYPYKWCAACDRWVPDSSDFCPYCGSDDFYPTENYPMKRTHNVAFSTRSLEDAGW